MEYQITNHVHFDPPITSDWSTFYYAENFFKDRYIEKLENLVNNNYSFSKGTTGTTETGELHTTETNNQRYSSYISK